MRRKEFGSHLYHLFQQVEQFEGRYEAMALKDLEMFGKSREEILLKLVEMLPPGKVLSRFDAKQRLQGLRPEERLQGLRLEEVLSRYDPEEVLSRYDPEEVLKALTPEQRERFKKLLH